MNKIIDERDAIIHAEQKLAQAHLTPDLDMIDSLLHPEYEIIQPDGRIETKADDFDYAARFLSIWIKEGGRWQNVAYHSTDI